MGRNETTITVVGNVASDVTHKFTATGVSRSGFRVAVTERRYDADSQQWGDGDKMFLAVTCWRRLADGVAASLSKGDPVIVTGRLHVREYEADGQHRSLLEVDASAVGPDLTRCFADPQRNRAIPEIAPPRREQESTEPVKQVVDAPF